ncbi:MAG: nucleotide sugar dehydrogenase [Anaerolineales bacterium]|jgi:UDP-N-acetyl-D-glucosamine dehydrogenase
MTIERTALPSTAQSLVEKFEKKEARLGIVGLGYVGLPLAMVLCEGGYEVVGLDTDARKIEMLRAGKSYVEDVPSRQIKGFVERGSFTVTSEYSDLAEVDGISICVPTPLRQTGDPDLSYIIQATSAVLPVLHQGMVVILESTTYPGTTREMLMPEIEASGLKVGEDLFLAFSPERVDPGRQDWTTANTPKVIGGITPVCSTVAAAMYAGAMKTVVPVTSTEVAEMTKLLENTFRAVNIGLVNEMALMCDRLGIDVWEVIDAAATKPFGFMKFTPGPGLGGHCIPIDPLYLSWKLKSVQYTARFIELASEINTNMPRYVVQRIQDAMNAIGLPLKGRNLLVLGAAYKPDISDVRESPALDVIGLLREKGADVHYYDPYVPEIHHDEWAMQSEKALMPAVKEADCVVIITDHQELDYKAIAQEARLVFDSRNAMGHNGLTGENIVRM